MPIFSRDDLHILFAHVPKTGGTALERLFTESGFDVAYSDAKPNRKGVRVVRRCSPQHLHATPLTELLRLDRIPIKFTVVREPVARFRSEFAHRFRTKDVDATPDLVESWGLRQLRRRSADPWWKDNHFRPQHEFVTDAMRVHRYEDGLEDVVDTLNREFGLGLSGLLRSVNTSTPDRRSEDVRVPPRLHEELVSLYAKDYEQFGYAVPTADTGVGSAGGRHRDAARS